MKGRRAIHIKGTLIEFPTSTLHSLSLQTGWPDWLVIGACPLRLVLRICMDTHTLLTHSPPISSLKRVSRLSFAHSELNSRADKLLLFCLGELPDAVYSHPSVGTGARRHTTTCHQISMHLTNSTSRQHTMHAL